MRPDYLSGKHKKDIEEMKANALKDLEKIRFTDIIANFALIQI